MKKPEVPQKKKIKTMGIFNNQIIKENLTIRKAFHSFGLQGG